MKFSELTAQKRVADYMRRAVESRRLSHAYILDGERGSGKRSLAESFAAALLCEKCEVDGACGSCRSCRLIASENHPDLIYIMHTKKHITVEDIRDQLVATVNVRPYQSDYKIYVIDEAEKMTSQSQNALLKSLEEPPPYVVILLLVSNSNLLLETIRSRCVQLILSATPDDILKEIVTKKASVPDYRIDACVAFAQGNVGKALLLVESDSFEERRLKLFSMIGKLDKTPDSELISYAEQLEEEEEFLDLLLIYFKDVLLYKATHSRNALTLEDQAYHIVAWAEDTQDRSVGRIPELILDARRKLAANSQKKLVVSTLLFELKEIRKVR